MSSVVIAGDTSGSVTLQAPATAGSVVVTLPSANGTMLTNNSTITPSAGSVNQAAIATGVAGTGPAFSAYTASAQAISTNTLTKVLFGTEEFDTNNNFASSTFTPTVAGYYQISASIGVASTNCQGQLRLFKNGASYKFLQSIVANAVDIITGSTLVYCNGTTDYLEIYTFLSVGQNLSNSSTAVYFNGVLVRSA